MNLIHILLAVLAVSSSVSFASDPKSNSALFEMMSKEDPEETQRIEIEEEPQETPYTLQEEMNSSSDEEEPSSSKEKTTSDVKDIKGTSSEKSLPDTYQGPRDEDLAASKFPQYSPIMQFAHRVRTAVPHLAFTAIMTGFTFNELNDRDGPDASIIPLSSMALLGGYHAIQVLRSGQNIPYNIVPHTVREVVRTGASLLPGLVHTTYGYLTQHQSSTISEETKQCVRKCLE